jgi:hypothetical protein
MVIKTTSNLIGSSLILILFFSIQSVSGFAQNINKSKSQSISNNPFNSLTEKQFVSMPGKNISDTLVKFLLFSKYADWQVSYDSVQIMHGIKDSIHSKKIMHLNYFNVNDGIEFSVEEDTVRNIVIHTLEEDEFHNHWRVYNGKLPYGLNTKLTRHEIINILGVPNVHTSGNIIWYYPDKKLNIEFTSDDYNSAKIRLFVLYK